jgi:tetratricopeptide (TPR) repeat protein
MASVCIGEQGDCLQALGRLEQAATAYQVGIRGFERANDARSIAVAKAQLGTVRNHQGHYSDALQAFSEARDLFSRLHDLNSVATSWHQAGNTYYLAGQPEAAEDAYRKSLEITVGLQNVGLQANTLVQLGSLYGELLGQLEEAAEFYRKAANKYADVEDAANESLTRCYLAMKLRNLGRLNEARHEICRAIECGAPFGHATRP